MKTLFLNLYILFTAGAVYAQSVGIGTNNPSGKFHISNSSSGIDALFFVDTTGNVGIGNMAPQDKLDVTGSIIAQSTRIVSSLIVPPLQVDQLSILVDQQQGAGSTTTNEISPGWQSFTAGTTSILNKVALSFDAGAPFQAVLKIYSGEGTGGTQLASVNLTIPVSGGPNVASPDLNIPVIAGNKYTIWINNRYAWEYAESDVYSGGRAETATTDRRFRTYIKRTMTHLIVSSDGNVGIGAVNPTEKLVVETTNDKYGLIHTNGTVSLGTFVGGNSIYGGWIGTRSDHPLMFFTNNGSSQMTLLQNGNIGIGTVSPAYKLQVSGFVAANDFVNLSDARLKRDIVPLSDALSKVVQLNGVTYYWKNETYPQFQFDTNHKIGFLAQQVEKIMPELVAVGTDGYKTVNYIEVVPLLVESIKELQHRIDEQQKLNELLKARLEKIDKHLQAK